MNHNGDSMNQTTIHKEEASHVEATSFFFCKKLFKGVIPIKKKL
jgi:hypothetical protein